MNLKSNAMRWSWVLFISFFLLSIIDMRFGIAGLVCMIVPLVHALSGKGKIHCARFCPRGSFLKYSLKWTNFKLTMPKFMKSDYFKHSLLGAMFLMFGYSLYMAGGDFMKIAHAVFRLMAVSTVLAISMGIIFHPRAWCTVCPMGHATKLIGQKIKV